MTREQEMLQLVHVALRVCADLSLNLISEVEDAQRGDVMPGNVASRMHRCFVMATREFGEHMAERGFATK